MKRVISALVLVACHHGSSTTDAAPPASASASVTASAAPSTSAEEEEQEGVEQPGACPQPITPAYCRRRCRTFAERMRQHHAKRVTHPTRVAYGTCGGFDVFAESDSADAGIVEYFGDAGSLVAAHDGKRAGCRDFGNAPACSPTMHWSNEDESGADDWPTMRFADVKSPGLPPEVVQRIVRRDYGAMAHCHTALLERAPAATGVMHVAFTLDASGTVKNLTTSGTFADAPTAACLRSLFEHMTFPAPEKPPQPVSLDATFAHGRVEHAGLIF